MTDPLYRVRFQQLPRAEQHAAITDLHRQGLTARDIAQVIGWHPRLIEIVLHSGAQRLSASETPS